MTVCLPLLMLTSCSKDDDSDGDSGKPSRNDPEKLAVTGSVTDITPLGATISGWANIDPVLTVAAKFGVIVSLDSKPSYSNGMVISVNELKPDNSYQVSVTDLTPGTTFYYLSFVKIGDIYTYGDVRSFSTMELHLCPDNHHPHAIDLGLPSGTKWACCNVGATTPEDYGGYYAWGETSEKSIYLWWTYTYGGSDSDCPNIGFDIADTQYDVAHVKMGGSWRMPSHMQQMELKDNCICVQWNGMDGFLAIGKNGGQIFLPAAGRRFGDDLDDAGSDGFYWSSSLYPDYNNSIAYDLSILNIHLWDWNADSRFKGLSVRAVCP